MLFQLSITAMGGEVGGGMGEGHVCKTSQFSLSFVFFYPMVVVSNAKGHLLRQPFSIYHLKLGGCLGRVESKTPEGKEFCGKYVSFQKCSSAPNVAIVLTFT